MSGLKAHGKKTDSSPSSTKYSFDDLVQLALNVFFKSYLMPEGAFYLCWIWD